MLFQLWSQVENLTCCTESWLIWGFLPNFQLESQLGQHHDVSTPAPTYQLVLVWENANRRSQNFLGTLEGQVMANFLPVCCQRLISEEGRNRSLRNSALHINFLKRLLLVIFLFQPIEKCSEYSVMGWGCPTARVLLQCAGTSLLHPALFTACFLVAHCKLCYQ